ncbi:MAG: tripartite tricarboxylate transporter substrate binding protein [Betaproteobacteria bacterium]|nr:tripartite tricarboxylate transporter substrate binding protein [Betaproteobacteria bacterium]
MKIHLHPVAAVFFAALALCAGEAAAQSYPAKPIRMIAPFPPGGAPDLFARLIGDNLGASLGQQVVVDNRPGAGGNIASEAAAKSPPDGYTLYLAAHPPFTLNPILFSRAPYDAIRDFAPIALAGSQWFVLAVNPTVAARTVQELIAHVKANPGKLSYASSGNGTPQHLGMEFFKLALGLDIVHVPYKGASLFVADLLNGTVGVALASLTVAGQHLKSGKLVPLALTSRQRSSEFPGLPTIAETVIPNYEVTAWFAVVAPAGTPREIIARLNGEIARTMAKPDVQKRLVGLGLEAQTSTPEELAGIIKAEIAKWGPIVRDARIKVD